MTESSDRHYSLPKRLRTDATDGRRLTFEEVYVCPVCRHGQISSIALMDAFACNFCRHIFTANLRDQILRVEDSSQPVTWHWNGQTWQATNRVHIDLTITIWVTGLVLIVLPPSLIWLSSHTFPPMHGSTGSWFPNFWIGLTFFSHFLFVSWLLVEHYQVPLYVACKVKLRELVGQR